MSKARPLPLPPSGISVWRPLSSSEGGLVAILGSGPSTGEYGSDEDVQCVWCGLRSRQAAACEVCGSPLYESIAIWQPASSAPVEEPPPPVRNQPAPAAAAPAKRATPPAALKWPTPRPASRPAPGPAPRTPEPAPETAFKAFKRFAGLEIRWVLRSAD